MPAGLVVPIICDGSGIWVWQSGQRSGMKFDFVPRPVSEEEKEK